MGRGVNERRATISTLPNLIKNWPTGGLWRLLVHSSGRVSTADSFLCVLRSPQKRERERERERNKGAEEKRKKGEKERQKEAKYTFI